MKIIENEKFIYCLMAFDQFTDDVDSLATNRRDKTEIVLKRMAQRHQFEKICDYVNCKDSDGRFIIIDFDRITNVGDRILHMYLVSLTHIIIINARYACLTKRINEDLPRFTENNGCYFSDSESKEFYISNIDEINNVYERMTANIVREYTELMKEDNIRTQEPMDSSNVYSNMYIKTARLFLEPLKFRFITYRLLCLIDEKHPDKSDIDAFISASRTGANIANIVGWLLGKKVIYCTNLGPKYSLSMQYLVNDIRTNKKYVYLFDFLCLGTEAKLLNAILMIKGAELKEGYGIAAYTSNRTNLLDRMHALVDVNKNGFKYATVSEKTDILSIIREEEYDYGGYRLSKI